MADFSITDSGGNPVAPKLNATAASLNAYLKSEALHLMVVPDFMSHKDQLLTLAAPQPQTYQLTVQHDFQLGSAAPEVDITPHAQAVLQVNATAGTDLLDDDSFQMPCHVPNQTGYVGLSIAGSLDVAASGSTGALNFGIDRGGGITFEYFKAFSTGANQPTLGSAAMSALTGFVIPATIADLSLLGAGDVCSVAGQGSLTVSGGVSVQVPVNPLASVNLPVGPPTVAVQAGAMAGVSVSFTLTGSYQIRLEKLSGGAIRLSYLKEKGTKFETDLTGSAGVTVMWGKTELLAKLMGAIEKGGVDQKLLDGLSPEEVSTFTAAVKAGIDHSLQASINAALTADDDDQAAFQYEIRPELFNAQANQAVANALRGDLSLLTALEESAQKDGMLAPGVKLLNSVFTAVRTTGASLKLNLLGIVNLVTMSKLISGCEFLFEPASGELTIKETAQSEKISAITDPLEKQEALRKALFYSVLATTTYVVGKAITMPSLNCQSMHFAVNQNTNKQTVADYTNWFITLNLMTASERAEILNGFGGGGPSKCILRTQFDNARSEALFLDAQGKARARSEYLEIGRQALKALLDPDNGDMDRCRYQFFDNATTWGQAVAIGPNPSLGTLLPFSSTDPKYQMALADVTGDLFDIVWWADSMQKTGLALQQMRDYLSGRDPATLANDPAFAQHRDGLQKRMLDTVAKSKLRFHEPWGMVCLYQAAGARGSSGILTAKGLELNKSAALGATAEAG